jgi:hypothetical protein
MSARPAALKRVTNTSPASSPNPPLPHTPHVGWYAPAVIGNELPLSVLPVTNASPAALTAIALMVSLASLLGSVP